MSKNKTTIYDIAKHLRISPATVSRAINNDVKISNDTILKVREAMHLLEYKPVPIHQRQGRRSSSHIHGRRKSPNIVFLHNRSYNVWHRILPVLEEYMDKTNCSFETKYYSPNVSLDNADGVLLDFTLTDKRLLKLLRQKTTVQMFGNPGQSERLWDQITYDNSRVGTIAADYLIAQGHEVMAAFYPTNKVALSRAEAFVKTIQNAKKRVKTYVHPELEIDTELLEHQVQQIKSLVSKPTGLFVFNDFTAVALHSCLLKAGLNQNAGMEMIACDNNMNILSAINPRPATIEIHLQQIAKRAIEQLIWRLDNLFEPPVSIVIEPEIINTNKKGVEK